MDSIYFKDPLGLLIELASYRFEPPAGHTHADVLLEAHRHPRRARRLQHRTGPSRRRDRAARRALARHAVRRSRRPRPVRRVVRRRGAARLRARREPLAATLRRGREVRRAGIAVRLGVTMIDLTAEQIYEPETVAALLRQAPEGGVLSIYVEADLRGRPGPAGAGIDIEPACPAPAQHRSGGAAGTRRGAQDALAASRRRSSASPTLRSPGAGARSSLRSTTESDPVLEPDAALQPRRARRTPFVHPLLELLDEGRRPASCSVSQDEARLLEWRLGELHQLDRIEPDVVEAPHERSDRSGRARSPRRTPQARAARGAR